VESCNTWSFVTGSFSSGYCLQDSPCNMCQYFIPSYGHYSILWLPLILFVHSSTDRHLSCFPFGAIMNNAAMNIHVRIFVWTCFPFNWVYIQVELLDLWQLFQPFRNSQTIFPGVCTIHTPTSSSWLRLYLLTSLLSFCHSHPSMCEVVSRCSFDLHFLDSEHFFHVLISHLYIFGRNVHWDPLPIFNWVICLFNIQL
jgi:hypothetical protein